MALMAIDTPVPSTTRIAESTPVIFRIDSLGRLSWARRYLTSSYRNGAIFYHGATPLARVSDSVFAFAGTLNSGQDSIVLTEINSSGEVLWCKDYTIQHVTNFSLFASMALTVTPSGGVIIGGNLMSKDTNYTWHPCTGLIAVNDTGGLLWAKYYADQESANNDYPGIWVNKILNVPGGGFLVNGLEHNSNLYRRMDNFLFRISGSGGIIWHKNYGFPISLSSTLIDNYYQYNSDIVSFHGGYYIMGEDTSSGNVSNPNAKYTYLTNILKLDTSGNLIWAKGYRNMEGIGDILRYDSSKNSLFLFSYADSLYQSFHPGKPFLARLDTSGNVKYAHTYTNAAFSTAVSYNPGAGLIEIPGGFALMLTAPDQLGSGLERFCLIKTDTAGLTNGCGVINISTPSRKEKFSTDSLNATMYDINISVHSRQNPTANLPMTFQVSCEPFVSWFGWKDTCSGYPTRFFDSTYTADKSRIWDFGDTASGFANSSVSLNPLHTFMKPGTYKVKLIADNGTNKDTITRLLHIAVSPLAFNIDTMICAGDSVNMIASPGGAHYRWNNTALLADSTSQSVWAYPYQDTIFSVNVISVRGCSNIDSFRVKVNKNCPNPPAPISGIINKYAAVSVIDTCLNAFTVDTASPFTPGGMVLIIQAKGAAVDTINDSTFGLVKTIGGAGSYEYNTVDSVSGNQVFLGRRLLNTYNVQGAVQLVAVPQYGSAIVTDILKPLPWTGKKGGVLVFNASGTVIMAAPLNAAGAGFRGGALNTGGTTCHKNGYYYSAASGFGANKGEGIAVLDTGFTRGMGKAANGGGGGNSYQAGGGGGSNAGAGGRGGNELSVCGTPLANGGLGGGSLSGYSAQNHLFMGGGGGAGFFHTGSGTPGTNGGGIIMINANKIASDGQKITADGATQALKAILDGAGGGGAGGSVLLNVNNYGTSAIITANGGKGGSDSFTNCKGTGGGGGGGVLLITSSAVPGKILFSATGGTPGINLNKSAPCYNSSYGADSGQNGISVTRIAVPIGSQAFIRPRVSILNATVADSAQVLLSFTKSMNPNVTGYKIFRADNNGAFAYLTTVYHPSSSPVVFTDSIKTSTDSFSYHVYTLDTCGDVSNYSATHTTIHLKYTINGCEQAIYLKWNHYAGWPVKKYEIYRSVNNGNETVMATMTNNVLSYKDTTVNYHNQYCYRVLAYDSTGPYTSWSERTCGHTYFLDTAKIITVSKTVTSTANGTMAIRWQSVTGQKYIAGTELYYSAGGRHYSLLATLPATQDSFVQTGLNTLSADQYYYIKNIDSCGTVSDSSVVNKTMTLTVSVGELLHKLNWTPYLGFKIKSYKIEKLVGTGFVVIDSVPATDTSMRYFPAPCNHVERYRIAAIGYNPGEISMSDTMGRKAIDTIPPNAAKITELAVLGAKTIQLNFISSDSPDVYTYVVQRAINNIWGNATNFITHLHGTPSAFVDTINTTSNQLCYTVITLDSCLNAAESDTVCSEPLSGKALFCKAQVQLALPKVISPPTAPDSFVVYRSTDKVNYNQINELPIADVMDVDTDVMAGTAYYYKLETVYNKANMTSYSDIFSITPRLIPDADSAQLVYATVLKSDETHGSIYIVWKRAVLNDTNARGYYVYSFNTANGKYALLKDVTDLNDTSYIQNNINTLQNAYKYYIITYNVCDVGINSNIHRTVLLKVQNNNLNEQLNWISYLGVPVISYSVYKSRDGGAQFLVNNAGLDSVFADSNITCNHNYTYQVQAILANGEISFSDSITVKSFDTITPVTRPILIAIVVRTGLRDGRIELDWLATTDKNLAGYNIYRSIDGLYWSLVIDHWPGTSLTDTGLNTYRQAYYYKIQPVDSCGNTGPFTTYHESIQLTASAGNGYNQLYWNGYVGWKVKKYLVFKNGVLIDSLANNVFAFKDTAVICNTVYQYLIKAIDSVNYTIISASNTDSAKALNHIPPQKVYIKTVTVSNPNKAASISWTPSKSYDVKNYFVFRKNDSTGSMVFVDSTTNLSNSDSNLNLSPPLGVRGGVGGHGAGR